LTATNGELVTQVRQLIDQAHQQGRARPGRPTLVALTGATDHEIRKALAELATENTSTCDPDTRPADVSADDRDEDSTPSDTAGAGTAPVAPPSPAPTSASDHPTANPASSPATAGDATAPASPAAASAGHSRPHPTPAGGRLVAWTGFVFGSNMSIAANVLHTWLPATHQPPGWTPDIPPQIGAAVWPIGLMLAVEALSRIRWPTGLAWGLARFGGAGTVALGSAVISYGHLRDVLLAWQYGPLADAVGPLVLDGLKVVCGFALLANSLTNTAEVARDDDRPT